MAKERGFTIVEILVAVMILSVGVIALVGSSAAVTRMVGRGKASTITAQVASRRFEWLRALAMATATPCTHSSFQSSATPVTYPNEPALRGISETWAVATTGNPRLAKVYVTYQARGGPRVDSMSTLISCYLP